MCLLPSAGSDRKAGCPRLRPGEAEPRDSWLGLPAGGSAEGKTAV